MKWFTGIFLLISTTLAAQNLVPNPSFEEYTSGLGANINSCGLVAVHYWFTPTLSTDYFNANFNVFSDNSRGIPNNINGYQLARTGQAYAGHAIFIPTHGNNEYAEHLEIELIDTLIRDSFYQVELFLSYANDSNGAAGQYGVLFTSEAIGDSLCIPNTENNPMVIPTLPQLEYRDTFLTDTLNWMQLCWIYQAAGNEKFMTLGAFGPLDELLYTGTGPAFYYYVDDVSVLPVSRPLADPILPDTVYWCEEDAAVTLTTANVHDSYQWSTGAVANSITVNAPGWYWVETYALDCSLLRDSVWVELLESSALDLGPPVLSVCPEDLPLVLGTGSELGAFVWNDGSTAATFTVGAAGQYTVVQQHPCLTFRDTLTILVDEPPPLALLPDTLVCAADFAPYTLMVPSVYATYTWSDGSTGNTILVNEPGTYTLNVTHPCGAFTASHTLAFADPPPLPSGVDTVLCAGAILAYAAPADYLEYAWSHGPQTAQVTLVDTGTYVLMASHPCGDAVTALRLQYASPLEVNIVPIPSLKLGESQQLQPQIVSGEPVSWAWSPAAGLSCTDCPEPALQPFESGVYELTVTDRYGCTATTSVAVTVTTAEVDLYAPNAFSPNSDGINDTWTIYPGPAISEILEINVFDRWGALVWALPESTAIFPPVGWDGHVNRKPASAGAYVWFAIVKLLNGEQRTFSGELVLVR